MKMRQTVRVINMSHRCAGELLINEGNDPVMGIKLPCNYT